jgi:hypothetical protein
VFKVLRQYGFAKVKIVRRIVAPKLGAGRFGDQFTVLVIYRGQDNIIGAHGLIEQVLYLFIVAGIQVKLGCTGDLASNDVALGAQYFIFLVNAAGDLSKCEKNVDQQHRYQCYQQNLILEAQVLHGWIRSS